MKKIKYITYILCVWLILLIPFAGMTFWPTNETTENTVLAEWPKWQEDGKWNKNYLAEMGEYFEDHFAFRQNFVTANALIRGKVLQTSATDQVVVGTEEWLYYGGTLDDYQGNNLMTDRELYAAAHNIKLMQNYVESRGSQFLLMVAPNKNSLYNDNMPFYCQQGEASNLELFSANMQEEGIHYLDLYQLFNEQEEVLYFKRDSHWNNKGAVLVYNELMNQLGKEHETYLNVPCNIENIHSSDLDEMLYPLAVELEDEYVYDKEFRYKYVNEITDNMDDWIETENLEEDGTLLMYRDSFGESLLPFVADEVGNAYFSRLVPYNLAQVEQYSADYVIIERVERRLSAFVEEAPIMEPLITENLFGPEAETSTTLEVEEQGSYLLISGEIDESYIKDETDIYVSVRNIDSGETKTYPVFYILTEAGDGNGYQIYLRGSSISASDIHINIIVQNDGQNMIVASKDITN